MHAKITLTSTLVWKVIIEPRFVESGGYLYCVMRLLCLGLFCSLLDRAAVFIVTALYKIHASLFT